MIGWALLPDLVGLRGNLAPSAGEGITESAIRARLFETRSNCSDAPIRREFLGAKSSRIGTCVRCARTLIPRSRRAASRRMDDTRQPVATRRRRAATRSIQFLSPPITLLPRTRFEHASFVRCSLRQSSLSRHYEILASCRREFASRYSSAIAFDACSLVSPAPLHFGTPDRTSISCGPTAIATIPRCRRLPMTSPS